MKARYLKKLLNDTEYNVHITDEKVCVGSELCHDLISVDRKTWKIKYALDTFNKGRASLERKEKLGLIWDMLQALIDTGELIEIISGTDIIENPLPVFYVQEGVLIESTTDKYGWPNVTAEGLIMGDGWFYPTAKEAIDYAIKYNNSILKSIQKNIDEKEEKIVKLKEEKLKYFNQNTDLLQSLKAL